MSLEDVGLSDIDEDYETAEMDIENNSFSDASFTTVSGTPSSSVFQKNVYRMKCRAQGILTADPLLNLHLLIAYNSLIYSQDWRISIK